MLAKIVESKNMKTTKLLVILIAVFFLNSCEEEEVREELPGIATSISGNVKDHHRNLNISNYEIKLIKYWSCPDGGIGPNYCTRVIATTYSDLNGNYQLDFSHNLRSDESYRIAFNEIETNNYYLEFVSPSGAFYQDFEPSNLVPGENNILNLNAWIPIKIRFNLTVLNNHTPPLVTGIAYNDDFDFGTQLTYNNSNSFEIYTRPNSAVSIKFWYIENYNSSNPIMHYAPVIPYTTNEAEITELNYEVDCNTF